MAISEQDATALRIEQMYSRIYHPLPDQRGGEHSPTSSNPSIQPGAHLPSFDELRMALTLSSQHDIYRINHPRSDQRGGTPANE